MGSTDRLFFTRHPLRWLRHFWPHFILAAALVLNGVALTGGIFRYVGPHTVWPWAMYLVAAVVLWSLWKPMRFRRQLTVSLSLMGLAAFRTIAYLQVIATTAVPVQYMPILWSFIAHWLIVGVVAMLWPQVSEMCFTAATAEAGKYRIVEGRGEGAVG